MTDLSVNTVKTQVEPLSETLIRRSTALQFAIAYDATDVLKFAMAFDKFLEHGTR